MAKQNDLRVSELGNTVLTLRGDLVFSPRSSGRDTFYLVEDSLRSKFYRLGRTEYTFVSLLDGRTSIDQALRLLSTAQPDHLFTVQDAASICKWLIESNLAHTTDTAASEKLSQTATRAEQHEVANWLNPLIQKLVFGNPDRLFERITPWLAWFFSPLALATWVMIVSYGAFNVYSHWDEFVESSRGMFAPANWAWLAGCWIVLKILHEASHGIVCKKYGGHVRETGVIFVVLAPLAFVDVTSSWRFKSRWQRIHTAAAGMYVELFVAALAAIAWSHTTSDYISYVCYNLIVMSSLTTIVFNANPLMKFDGYYILSDLLGIPNLYVNGQQYLRYWSRRYLLGLRAALPPWSKTKGLFIRLYGPAAFCWRVLITVGLTVTAATLFHGAGIVLVIAAIVLWLGVPSFRVAKFLLVGRPEEQPNRFRFLCTVGPAVAALAIVFTLVPWPGTVQAPVVVEFSSKTFVHARSPGFVAEIFVHGGQTVRQGDKLVVLNNKQLEQELANLRIEMEQSSIKSRMLEQKNELAAFQAERENYEALEKRLAEKQSEVAELTIHASCDGKIIGRNLDILRGTYVGQGAELFMIGDDRMKELRASISQDDGPKFNERLGQQVSIHLPGFTQFASCLSAVDPRASVQPTHHAFCGVNNGPIAVKRADQKAEDKRANVEYTYLAPRFTGVIKLNEQQSRRCAAGQMGQVVIRPFDESFGIHLLRTFRSWIRDRLAQLTQ